MKFSGREKEIGLLEKQFRNASKNGQMTVITGRRRIGKTMLSLEYAQNYKYLYLFISRKSEKLLCEEFVNEIKVKFDFPIIGQISTFKEIFKILLEIAQKEKFILIIDEFQDFFRINPSVYSDIQHLWDLYKNRINMHVIFIGSIYSLMHKIFKDSKEPLFGRADKIIELKPFQPQELYEILNSCKNATNENVFNYYVLTGGIPKYVDYLISNDLFEFDDIISDIISENSLYLHEGKQLLIEEFGKDYTIYFSILELISSSKTSRTESESILEKTVGGYLNKLEVYYSIIKKETPIFAKPKSRNIKYKIDDNFLNFWFRFINKNDSALAMGNFEYIIKIIKRDYNTYCVRLLEEYFHQVYSTQGFFNKIGNYWEKGNKNEIDMVAVNEMEKNILFADIKLNKEKLNIGLLKSKAQVIINSLKNYEYDFIGLSLENCTDQYRLGK